jgi:hypothetical protein
MEKIFILPDWKALRNLTATLQQSWFYGWTHCDACGVFELDEPHARVDMGRRVTCEEFEKMQAAGVYKIDANKFLFIDFIRINNSGTIKENYNPHKPVFRALQKHGLTLSPDLLSVNFNPGPRLNEGSTNLIGEGIGKGIGKDIKVEPTLFEVDADFMPWKSPEFLAVWNDWKEYRRLEHKFKFASDKSERATLTELSNLAGGDQAKAIEIVMQSLSKGYKGFFELKNNSNGTDKNFRTVTGGHSRKSAGAHELIDELRAIHESGNRSFEG